MDRDTLLVLAERCEKADGPDRVLDTAIFDATNERANEREGRSLLAWTHCYTSSYDAAMSLVPRWLTPSIIGHDREVRLLNGIGLTVGGDDFLSVAPSLQRGITAAALRALARTQEPTPC